MKCHACEYFVSPDHCYVEHGTVNPCPEGRACDKFKYEASYGEIAQLEREKERERCAKICSAGRRAVLRLAKTTGDEGKVVAAYTNGKVDMAAECERKIRGEKL